MSDSLHPSSEHHPNAGVQALPEAVEPSSENALSPIPADSFSYHSHLGMIPTAEDKADPSPTMVTAGKALVPGYMLVSELGRGGMGVVYRAVQLGLNRPVALKMVLAGAFADAAQRNRFRTEAEAIAKLQDPAIVQIYEIGEFEGMPFYSLELTEGGSLADRLRGHPFPPHKAARLVETLARAMEAAHQKGIIHRDLKPANILLTAEGQPKISDFGLAKNSDPDAPHTADGAIMGTPTYMAPEQAAGNARAVGPATDVYSLGVILYEMLTGRPPFKGASMIETLEQVRNLEPRELHLLQKDIPRDLETICLKCLQKEPQQRYPTALALAEDLRRYLEDRPIHARATPFWERGRKWIRRHPGLAATLTGILLLAALGAGWSWWVWDARHRVTVSYHSAIVRRHGTWEGISPLTPEQVSRRAYTYRLHERGGRIAWCDIVNGLGHHSTQHPLRILLDGIDGPTTGWRIARIEFLRNDKDQIVEERLYDRAGRLVWVFHYTTDTTGHFTDAQGLPRARAGSGASYVKFQRNDAGYEVETSFYDAKGQRQPAADGTFGVRMEVSPRGLRTAITCLDMHGRPVKHRSGATTLTHEYDDLGHVIQTAYWDENRKPVRYRDSFHRLVYTRDPWGNEASLRYYDIDGRLCTLSQGYAGIDKAYDSHGNLTSLTYVDASGLAVLTAEGHAIVHRGYDAMGNCVEERSFDEAGTPTLNMRGYHLKRITQDAGGYPVEERYFDAHDRPTLNRFGYARRVLVPGNQEFIRDARYYDLADKPLPVEPVIATLYPGGLADQLGLKVGDALQTYGGEKITHRYHLEHRRHRESPDSPTATLTLRRGDRILEFSVRPCLLGITLEDHAIQPTAAANGR